MKKKATLIIALAAAFSCTAAFAGPADSSRWTIDGDYAILVSDDGIENTVARALLPLETDEGMRLLWENFVYTLID